MRKFVIGFVSLCVVLAVYLLYNRLSSSPAIDTGPQIDFIKSASDANAVSLDSDIGKIGNVGVGPANKAYFVKLNEKTKEVELEFGFEKLLSKSRDIWDTEKPYMNIYRHNFRCDITADKGKMQVVTAVGRTTPKDATFSSNVVVHIFSGPPDDAKESFVYLDDIVFLSDRSLLSSAGPVKFVSQDIRMDGAGLELIYNEQDERLEYFVIKDLKSLNITGPSAAMFSPGNTGEDASTEADSRDVSQQPDESSVAVDTQKVQTPATDTKPRAEQKQGVYYKCTFNKNVLINTPEQLIFAADKLCINDIFWSKSFSGRPDENDAGDANDSKIAAGIANTEPGPQAAGNTGERQTTAPKPAGPNEPNTPSVQLENIVITCDGGFVVAPRDSIRAQEDTAANEAADANRPIETPSLFAEDTHKTRFFARRIDYNATTGEGAADGRSELTLYVGSASGADTNEAPVPVKVTAREGANFYRTSNKIVFTGDCLVTMPQSGLSEPNDVTFTASEIVVNLPKDRSGKPDMFATGPAELVFYMEDANSPAINARPVPVTVNAQKQARFSAASNQIVFSGDSRCMMHREDPNVVVQYLLLSEQLTVDLPADTNDSNSVPKVGIKHFTATGEVVRLATTKTAKAKNVPAGQLQEINIGKLLSGIELKCSRFDYDAIRPEFVATGPGLIKLDNSKAPEPNQTAGRFSLQKPCWAVLDGFDSLRYFIRENRIIADAGPREKLQINYIPAVDGRYDEYVRAKASHIEAMLYELPSGRTELSTLSATGGIQYEDKDNQFIGSEMFYDHQADVVKVKGDKSQPCYYNGIPVDGIEMDLKTGKVKKVKFDIVGPGSIQMNRNQP
jgi:hypothetical protein